MALRWSSKSSTQLNLNGSNCISSRAALSSRCFTVCIICAGIVWLVAHFLCLFGNTRPHMLMIIIIYCGTAVHLDLHYYALAYFDLVVPFSQCS